MGYRQSLHGLSRGYLPDSDIVALCRGGDCEAWGEFVERFTGLVHGIAMGRCRLGREDAEDVAQEVFARAYERLETLRSDGAIRAWIAQVTYCVSIDLLRKSSRERAADRPVDSEVPDEAFGAPEEAVWVQQMLDDVPAPCREILDRFFLLDQSYSTIGADLGLPPGTVASRISRGLARLRAVALPLTG
jgi:RNA polymerase sigma factor (sigma-70 family)